MFYQDIEKKFSDAVASYLANGYTFNTATMSGSQGEIAKVDLTDGNKVIRILLDSEFEDFYEIKTLTVGVAKNVKPGVSNRCNPIWNQNLEIISQEKFYQLNRDGSYYGTADEANVMKEKSMNRWRNPATPTYVKKDFPVRARKVVLPLLRRKKAGCKTLRLNQIDKVYKEIEYGNNGVGLIKIFAEAKGNKYTLYNKEFIWRNK